MGASELPSYKVDRIISKLDTNLNEADPSPDSDLRVDTATAFPPRDLMDRLLDNTTVQIARKQLREKTGLTDDDVEDIARVVSEATSQSVEEHRDALVEAFQEATDDSKKQRVVDAIISAAVTKIVDHAGQEITGLVDVVIEVLLHVLS